MWVAMDQSEIERCFTGTDGIYRFARWGRPIAPVVFGVDDATLSVVKGALEAVVTLAGHELTETDPELGTNLIAFFFCDWKELSDVPDLDKLIPDLGPLVARLAAEEAERYRAFRFDDQGGIQAAFVFLRVGGGLAKLPAEVLALDEMVRVMLLWSDRAFAEVSPLAVASGQTVLRPEIGDLIRAAYDPVMPVATGDASHALRLMARMGMWHEPRV